MVDPSDRPAADEHSVASYVATFGPLPEWDELVRWPPDVFAAANLVLDHTESYRFVVAPPSGRRWPPLPDWSEQVRRAAEEWRSGGRSPLVERSWATVGRYRDVAFARIRRGEAWSLTAALLTLHAVADEACAGVACSGGMAATSFERRAWAQLQERGSLSRLSPRRIRIVPKGHLAQLGITIRSLSRHLALCYEAVDVRWRRVEPAASAGRRDVSILLVPWPLSIDARDFRVAQTTSLGNMDLDRFGFFDFVPELPVDCEPVGSLLAAARDETGSVDAVVLPEGALTAGAIAELEHTLEEHGTNVLVTGVSRPSTVSTLGRNYLHLGIRTPDGWSHDEQDKHHRWCLDQPQIRQYHLTRSLDPERLWWEAIDIRERILHVIDMGGGMTIAPLVCEDLARLDEVADLVRRIGPSLVVAVLLDGPQLSSRWPARYASVIGDDPGSAVLTLTSYGMAVRSRPHGKPRSRVIAHWNDRVSGPREIELAPGAAAALVSATVETATLWTADGRCHRDVPRLELSGVRQIGARGPDSRKSARTGERLAL